MAQIEFLEAEGRMDSNYLELSRTGFVQKWNIYTNMWPFEWKMAIHWNGSRLQGQGEQSVSGFNDLFPPSGWIRGSRIQG